MTISIFVLKGEILTGKSYCCFFVGYTFKWAMKSLQTPGYFTVKALDHEFYVVGALVGSNIRYNELSRINRRSVQTELEK